MNTKYICSKCDKEYSLESMAFRCDCGGLLDLYKPEIKFAKSDIVQNEWSLFRYIKALPIDDNWKSISMGEGLTPIVPLDESMPNILVKVDYAMPTLSFKDRGAAVLIAKAKELGVKKVVQDSSGNAGTSIAAYASRAGIDCTIFVPEGTSEKKIKQIASHGADIEIVKGTREDTAKAALDAAENGDSFYASHVYNPFFYEGTKTYAYEIFEQLGDTMPESIVIPVGNGTLLLGAYYGFKELMNAGLIAELPRIIAVQTENCAPIYRSFIDDMDEVAECTTTGTMAEGIAIANPMRGTQILDAIRDTNGIIITAPEDRIATTRIWLSEKGFYVEPTTAATFAGYFEYINDNDFNERVIIPLCGAGLKK